jgi:hypothetical protein
MTAPTVSEADVIVDDGGRGSLEGLNVCDSQDKLRESEFLRQGVIIWDVIQAIHEAVHFNSFLMEG